MRRSILIAGLALLVAWSSEASANLITNGDFETGDFTGWTANPNVAIDSTFPNAGSYDAVFTASSTDIATLQQTVTTAGTNFILSFWLFNGTQDVFSPSSFAVSFGGSQVASFSTFDHFGEAGYFFTSVPVTASAGSTLLSFDEFNDSGDWNLDDVSLQAVGLATIDEPASVWMLSAILAGMLLYSSLWRRRSAFRDAE